MLTIKYILGRNSFLVSIHNFMGIIEVFSFIMIVLSDINVPNRVHFRAN